MPYIHAEQRQETDLVQLKLRFQERVRSRLEDAAKANGTSLNSEIVTRLDRSLEDDARGGSHETNRFLFSLASQIAIAERDTGKSWQEDAETYWLARLLMIRTMSGYNPEADRSAAYDVLDRAIKEKVERRDLLDGILTDCRAINRNALLMLEQNKEEIEYKEMEEALWVLPKDIDREIEEDDRTIIRAWLAELRDLRSEIAKLRAEKAAAHIEMKIAKDRALAAFERLTASAEV